MPARGTEVVRAGRIGRREDDLFAQLTCRELLELVTDYLEDALPRGVRSRFERHLRACAHCPTHLEEMRTTIRVLGSLSEETVEPVAMDELLVAFRGWRE